MKRAWLGPFTWPVIVETNRQICLPSGALHQPTSDGYEPTRQLWNSLHQTEMTLAEATDLCRHCHRLAPFCNYNGNTFVAVIRRVIVGLALPPDRAAVLRSLAGHIVAGTATAEEQTAFTRAIEELSPLDASPKSQDDSPHELAGKRPALAGAPGGAEAPDSLGGDSPECSPQHGVRAGAGGPRIAPRDTRPDRATRFIETTLGVLSYSQLAPLLAERVQRLEEAVQREDFDSRVIGDSLVCEFHHRICGDLTPDWAGRWRTVEVTVGPLTPPLPQQIPVLMRDFALDLQARWANAAADDIELTLELLAFAEGRFLSIHPFLDFNGRTVRVFLAEILRRLDLPLVDLAPENEDARIRYFAALEAADRRDWQPLVTIWKTRFAEAQTD